MSIHNIIKMPQSDVDNKFNGKVLIFDCNNIGYITAYSTIYKDYSDNGVFEIWKSTFLKRITDIIKDHNPDKVIMAFDSTSWRYSIFDTYKSGRKQRSQSGKCPLDIDSFKIALDEMREFLKETFTNIRVMKVEKAEADDIIAVLSKFVLTDENQKVIIVSTDSDLTQLTSNKNVSQYDPIKTKMFNSLNPKQDLKVKILSGDSSDSIPPIKKGVGPKTAEKILKEGFDTYVESLKTQLEKNTVIKKYELNKKLIDFNFIPLDVRNNIIKTYNEYEIIPLNSKQIFTVFMKNKLHRIRKEWTILSKYFKKLH